jgi:uncharacterized membrane protein (UPF0127 family)
MTGRRLLMVGGFLVLGGAALIVFVLVDRTEEPTRPATVSLRDFGQVTVRITDATGKTKKGCMLAARTARQRERGLMEVTDRTLGGHDGMVFLFEEPEQTGFWMRNTPMPLSIAYFDRGGRFVSQTDMTPCADSPTCPSYPPAGQYWSAIEEPRGGLARLGIGPGSRVEVAGSVECAA